MKKHLENPTPTATEIEPEFSFHGHRLRQIWRNGDVAVYQRSLGPDKPPHELEIAIIKVRPEQTMPSGNVVPEHEAYPTPSDWGRSGWSIPIRDKDMALKLAAQLSRVLEGRATFMRQALHNFWLQTHRKGDK